MRIVISRASTSDLDVVLRLLRAQYELDGYPFPASNRDRVAGLLGDERLGVIWLLHAGAPAVGILVLTWGYDIEVGGRLAVLTDLYVEANHRRQGIGTEAVRFAQRFCRDESINAIELQVERSNPAAKTFYERLGFQSLDRVPTVKRVTLGGDGPLADSSRAP